MNEFIARCVPFLYIGHDPGDCVASFILILVASYCHVSELVSFRVLEICAVKLSSRCCGLVLLQDRRY